MRDKTCVSATAMMTATILAVIARRGKNFEMKLTKIILKTREQILVKNFPDDACSFCTDCQTETVWLSPERAAQVDGLSLEEVFYCVEQGVVHQREHRDGTKLICFVSLLAIYQPLLTRHAVSNK